MGHDWSRVGKLVSLADGLACNLFNIFFRGEEIDRAVCGFAFHGEDCATALLFASRGFHVTESAALMLLVEHICNAFSFAGQSFCFGIGLDLQEVLVPKFWGYLSYLVALFFDSNNLGFDLEECILGGLFDREGGI